MIAKSLNCKGSQDPFPRIHSGCDFHLTAENIQDALAHPSKYTINHKRYLLVEFSDALIPNTTLEIFDRFHAAGITPVVTHPERNVLFQNRIDQLRSWVENGALVQVTGQSFLGRFGRTARRIAIELFDLHLVHFVASDGHDTKHRPPILKDARAYVTKRWGEQRAESVLVTAPRAAILGEPFHLDYKEQLRGKRKWYWFGR